MGRRRAVLEEPATRLSRALRAMGHAAAAARLAEVIPDGPIGGDEHRAELAARPAALAADPDLPTQQRAQAASLAGVAADLAPAIGRLGTVWILWSEPSPRAHELGLADAARYVMSWQSAAPDDDLYEDGPEFFALEEALAWADARTDSVIVRPAWDPATHYWAGKGKPLAGLLPLGRPPADSE